MGYLEGKALNILALKKGGKDDGCQSTFQ